MVAEHALAPGGGQAGTLSRVVDDVQHGRSGIGRAVRHQQVAFGLSVHATRRQAGGDHGHPHRHGFKYLVLGATGNGQRRHVDGRLAHKRPHIRHRAGDADARQLGQGQHLGHRVSAHDQQLECGPCALQQRPHLAAKALHAFDVGVVVHPADEADGVGVISRSIGAEETGVHPVGEPVSGRTGVVAVQRLPFGFGGGGAEIKLSRQALLGRQHLEALELVTQRQREGLDAGVLQPLL